MNSLQSNLQELMIIRVISLSNILALNTLRKGKCLDWKLAPFRVESNSELPAFM